jgi:two-component system response regulator HupR/HoxA
MSARPLLFVDDERNNRLVFQHSVGLRLPVLVAEGGEQALEIVARSPVRAVLADQRMPGMSGVELARALRERHPAVPRFMLTAYPQDTEVVAAMEQALFARLFSKPWNADELVAFFSRDDL